ncbi:MAG: BON domain-containing protein, partial [Acidobacteriota bacterium]
MNQLKSRSAAARPRSQRPDAGPLGDDRTDLLVIGSGRRLDAVASSLSSLKLVIRTARPSEAMLPSSGTVIGVVLVEPLGRSTAAQAVLSIRNRRDGEQLPIFVVLGARPPTSRIGELYRMDVTAVFEWPREADVFPHVVAELIGVTAVRGGPTREDSRLGRAVRARLKLHGLSPGQVRVHVREKEVSLSGTIDALWRKQALLRAVQRIPGVRRVTASELRVEPPRRSDRALARTMREVVKAVSPELS